MDAEKLKILRNSVSEKSILIVEDSKIIQNQIFTFLKKFFKNVYQAFDGQEGISQYSKYHPDIILTDLTMPKMNGLEMIKKIKLINKDVKIIILSAHNEEEVLMEAIKLNINNFLLKPLNIESFIDILLDILDSNKLNKYTESLHDLEILHQQKGNIRLVNYFEDLVIEQEGVIVKIFDNIISIKIPHTQILAIGYEGSTIIELKSIKKFMTFQLLDVNKEDHLIHISNPMYVEYDLKKNSHKQYFYDRKFSLGLHYHHKYFNHDVLDIVNDSVTLFIDSEETELEVQDSINLTISLNFTDDTQNKDIYTRGKIVSINRYKTGLSITSNIEIEPKDLVDFNTYLKTIEDGIIQELIEIIENEKIEESHKDKENEKTT